MEAIGTVVERVIAKAREASRRRDLLEMATRQGGHFSKDSVEEKKRVAPTSAEGHPKVREEKTGDGRPADRATMGVELRIDGTAITSGVATSNQTICPQP